MTFFAVPISIVKLAEIPSITKKVIAVPSEALLIDGDNEYVLLKKDKAVIKTKVTTGAEGNGFVEITEGLKLKDSILRTPLSDSTAALTQEIMSASPLK